MKYHGKSASRRAFKALAVNYGGVCPNFLFASGKSTPAGPGAPKSAAARAEIYINGAVPPDLQPFRRDYALRRFVGECVRKDIQRRRSVNSMPAPKYLFSGIDGAAGLL
jgi:hypothetical protein